MIPGGTPKAKAILWDSTDVEVRKRGDQKGLDTPVVHAVNDDLSMNSKILRSENERLHPFWRVPWYPAREDRSPLSGKAFYRLY